MNLAKIKLIIKWQCFVNLVLPITFIFFLRKPLIQIFI